jgi:peptidase E
VNAVWIALIAVAAIKGNFMRKIIYCVFIFLFLSGCLFSPGNVLAYQPKLVYSQTGNIQISNPEISQAFYDELKGNPRDYFIDSSKNFELYINLLVPDPENKDGRYSADVFSLNNPSGPKGYPSGQATEVKIYSIDGNSFNWQTFYEPFNRDYYLKGPELDQNLLAGKYKIEVYSKNNQGKYVLAVGKKEFYNAQSILNSYWQIPLLKATFFKTSVLQFFLTPYGIGGVAAVGALLIFLALINYLAGLIMQTIRHSRAKTLLLTSSGMDMKDEISKLLQKPAYDITVAFITTAAKQEENVDYVKKDWEIMKDEMGFNVEEVDIEGKSEHEVMKLIGIKDIIFVEGGNTFYLLKAMRNCHFEKIIRKLLKEGKVYIGASAGSMVAGKTIKTAGWLGEEYGNKNFVKLRNLKGLNLVPFDIFVHYQPEYAEIIKKKIPFNWQRRKLKILADGQAILIQGREVALIGKGDKIVI